MTSSNSDLSMAGACPTRKLISESLLSEAEIERRRLGAIRLKELYSLNPLYAAKAAQDPEYWSKLYDGRVNW